jgi:hypothetical protein
MIDDLDRTLEALLKKELPELFGGSAGTNGQVDISFATPDNSFASSRGNQPTINMFLYDIRENLELRNSERMFFEHNTKTVITQKRPPAQVDFSYMITAWAGEKTDPPPVFDEHRLLGAVMKVLLRHFMIPAELLQGELTNIEPLPRAFALQPGRLQSIGEFWHALGGKPKAAINYTVTMSVDAFKTVETGIVKDLRIDYLDIDGKDTGEHTEINIKSKKEKKG